MAVVGLRRDLGAGRWPGPRSSRREWLLSRSNWLSLRDRSHYPPSTVGETSEGLRAQKRRRSLWVALLSLAIVAAGRCAIAMMALVVIVWRH